MSQDKFPPSALFDCPECKARSAIAVKSGIWWYDREDGDFPTRYLFGSCVGCHRPAVVGQEIYQDYGDGLVDFAEFPAYPDDKRKLGFKVPDVVATSYSEASKCERSNAPIACVAMVRRTLEATVKEFDSSAKSIFTGLQKLKKDGVISTELWEWATHLRFLGNAAAHATDDEIEISDARDSMDFLQAILETLFHFRERFQAISAKRAKANPKQAKPA